MSFPFNVGDIVMNNVLWSRQTLQMRGMVMDRILDCRRDIDYECGYPIVVTPWLCKAMFKREGIARRVVSFWPDETWAIPPDIYETDDEKVTAFELAVDRLIIDRQFLHFMHRADEQSGIGRFGLLLYGLDDGRGLDQPVEGIKDTGEPEETVKEKKIIFFRVFDETQVRILTRETGESNPRFGQPTMYQIQFENPNATQVGGLGVGTVSKNVHWSRVMHFADGRTTDEVEGNMRQEDVYNNLVNVRKISGASGEGYWKGGFPGFAFEVDPEIAPDVDLDTQALRAEFKAYADGLQRFLALTGVSAKSLQVKITDPTPHMDMQLKLIALTKGIPYRIFLGAEEARLSSTMDGMIISRRTRRRQLYYTSPMMITPTINRFMAIGVLPRIKEFKQKWHDLNTMTDDQKAEIAVKQMSALVQYVSGRVESIIAPEQALTDILGIDNERAKIILKLLKEHLASTNGDGMTGLKAQMQVLLGPPTPSGKAPPGDKNPTDTQTTGAGGV